MKKSPFENKKDQKPRSNSLVEGAESAEHKPFVMQNFVFMGISLLLIVVGFLLMTGSSNNSPTQFNYDIFSTRRIVIGPAIAFIGFVAMAFSIVYSPESKSGKWLNKIVRNRGRKEEKHVTKATEATNSASDTKVVEAK